MKPRWIGFVLAGLLVAGAGPLRGQATVRGLSPGDRIRVARAGASAEPVTEGNLQRIRGDTLYVLDRLDVTQRIPLSSVTELEVSRGSWKTLGLVIGLGVGLVIAHAAVPQPEDTCIFGPCWGDVAGGLAILLGAGVGAVLGSRVHRWAPVTVDGNASVTLRPSVTPGGRFGLSGRIRLGGTTR